VQSIWLFHVNPILLQRISTAMYFWTANWATSVTNLEIVDKGEHALTTKDKACM